MKKSIVLTLIVFFLGQMIVLAQTNYERYNYFHDEAVKLKNEGKLDEAKEKFKRIRVICKGGIPEDNDLDKMIRECTTISFSESNLQFDAYKPQTKQVNVKVNAESIKVGCNEKWCTASKKGKTVMVSCNENDSPDPRTASVSVSADGKTVYINVEQRGGLLELDVYPDTIHFSKSSDSAEVMIATNASSLGVDEMPNWIRYELSDSVLYLMSMQNNQAYVREATFFVVAMDEKFPVVVSQAASDTSIMVDPDELAFPCTVSYRYLFVKSNLDYWRVDVSDDWIRAVANRDTIRVEVDDNESFFSRHGWVKIEQGTKSCKVPVHQYPYVSTPPELKSDIKSDLSSNKAAVAVKSVPSDLKVTIIDDGGESSVRYTPFDMPVDYGHYSLQMGFERREVFANERQQDVVFGPGLRFAALTWAPKASLGMMSGYVGAKSMGAYVHFQANTPIVTDYYADNRWLAGYNITVGPVIRPNRFPYVGVFAGVGIGDYVLEPHVGLDFEGGLMGFYKNMMLTMGFHTSRLNSTVQTTSFMIGAGGYLKRYYDAKLGYCSSDSRRWFSLNYVFRPSENGKGIMFGDLGKDKVRAYIKAMYLSSVQAVDSLVVRDVEAGAGIVITPVNSIIDLCLGASLKANIKGLEQRFQGIGVEAGVVLNIWRFPITVFLHEADLIGNRYLCVDFGFGFHLGEFGKSKSSYQ